MKFTNIRASQLEYATQVRQRIENKRRALELLHADNQIGIRLFYAATPDREIDPQDIPGTIRRFLIDAIGADADCLISQLEQLGVDVSELRK
jgi:hypothetical protein